MFPPRERYYTVPASLRLISVNTTHLVKRREHGRKVVCDGDHNLQNMEYMESGVQLQPAHAAKCGNWYIHALPGTASPRMSAARCSALQRIMAWLHVRAASRVTDHTSAAPNRTPILPHSLPRTRTQVGNSNLRTTMAKKKKPRMRSEEAMR